jgi:hypothetical protein
MLPTCSFLAIKATHDGETADEMTVQRCRACGERFTITAKID